MVFLSVAYRLVQLTRHSLVGMMTEQSVYGTRTQRSAPENASKGILGSYVYYVYSVSFSPDGQTLASGESGAIRLWDVNTGELLKTLQQHARSVSFSPDGQTLASGGYGDDDAIHLWDVNTGALLKTLEQAEWIESVSFSPDPDSQTLASGGYTSATISLWDANTGGSPENARRTYGKKCL